jgi:HEAT repeat protein
MDNQINFSDGNKPAQSLGTLQQFTSDQDPRVRTAALEALVSILGFRDWVWFPSKKLLVHRPMYDFLVSRTLSV